MTGKAISDRLGLVLLAALLLVSGLTYAHNLDDNPNFDEAAYTAALYALDHGQDLGTELVAVQPPGFYLLLDALGAVFGSDLASLRVGFLLLSLLGIAAAYTIGRVLAGPLGGLGAATILAVLPPYPALGALVEADPPSVTLALVALALALLALGRGREQLALSASAGAFATASVLVKLFTGTLILPLLSLAVLYRASWRAVGAAVGGGALVLGVLAVTHLDAVDEFWEGAVSGQLANRDIEAPSHLDNLERVVRTFDPRTPGAYLAVAGIALAVAFALRRRRLRLWPLWTWTAAAVAFTVWMRPLLDHHLVLLSAAVAVPAGTALGAGLDALLARDRSRAGSRRAPVTALATLGAATLLAAAGTLQQWRQLSGSTGTVDPAVPWAADRLREVSRPDDYVVSDLPYAAVLADRRMPGLTVDTSWGRVVAGTLTADEVMRTIERFDVPAVVTGRMLLFSPGLAAKLEARFPRRVRFDDTIVYFR